MIPTYLISNDQPFRVDYLVVAGGGRGDANSYPSAGSGGGGGAGGYISSVPGEQSGGPSSPVERIEFLGGQSVTVTVGAGGSGLRGGNSVFGSVEAIGGGKGENVDAPSQDGGSGGGAPFYNGQTAGSGTANQGNDGGPGSTGENFPANGYAGGGGGAGEAGSTDGTSEGGDGLASSITGTSTYYAGGGGGSRPQSVGTGVSGGLGGGGRGRGGDLRSAANPSATAGTANTGGGGGGGGANGGSGVVILRYSSRARIINYIAPGLTYSYSDDGTWKRYVFTAGTGNITF